jgi:hypothetical protein
MSRAGNMVGSFVTEDRSCTGMPWTSEDDARLAGTFRIDGRATRPHVMTPAGPYVIGAVSLWCRCGKRKRWARDATCGAEACS